MMKPIIAKCVLSRRQINCMYKFDGNMYGLLNRGCLVGGQYALASEGLGIVKKLTDNKKKRTFGLYARAEVN